MNRIVRTLAAALAGAVLTGCAAGRGDVAGSGSAQAAAVTVAAANFTEQLILGNIYALALEEAGLAVDDSKIGIGPREVYLPAMANGEIDVVPDYLGSLYGALQSREREQAPDDDGCEPAAEVLTEVEPLRRGVTQCLPEGLALLESSRAQDQDALAVTRETAQRFNLRTVSDLAPVAGELVAGGPPEEETRQVGLKGLKDVYGIEFADFVVTDAGGPVTLQALKTGRIQVGRVFTTTGFVQAEDLVVLEEDRPLVPGENVTPLVREDVRTPELEEALNQVSAALTTPTLAEMNKRVDVDKEDPAAVAEEFLRQALSGS